MLKLFPDRLALLCQISVFVSTKPQHCKCWEIVPAHNFFLKPQLVSCQHFCIQIKQMPCKTNALKETYYAHFSGSQFIFHVTTRICLHVLILKKHLFLQTIKCSSSVFHLCLRRSCLFKACPAKYPVSSDWLAHTSLNKNRAALLNQITCVRIATRLKLWKCVILWRRCDVTKQ